MLLKREGLPQEGELVFCTVTSVQYNSVFVKIEEYEQQGLIHISEISPGRIRNIRDFVEEGKMIVCKVLKIDRYRGNIDLSLRRVTEIQKRQKTDERKQEQKAEKIIETLATQLNLPLPKIYGEVASALVPKYGLLQYAFKDVVENDVSIESMGVNPSYAKKLEDLVKEKIKPEAVFVSGIISIKSFAENGVEVVKNTLIGAEKLNEDIKIRYLGGGNYSIDVKAKEFKDAEKILDKAVHKIEEDIEKSKTGEFSFTRKEKATE